MKVSTHAFAPLMNTTRNKRFHARRKQDSFGCLRLSPPPPISEDSRASTAWLLTLAETMPRVPLHFCSYSEIRRHFDSSQFVPESWQPYNPGALPQSSPSARFRELLQIHLRPQSLGSPRLGISIFEKRRERQREMGAKAPLGL